MDVEILLFAEGGDLAFTLDQHCQSRCLNTPDYQPLVVERGEKPGAVDTDNPICL